MDIKKYDIKKILVFIVALFIYSIVLIGITTMVVKSNINGNSSKKKTNNEIAIGNSICNLTSYNNNIIKYGNWIIFSTGVEFGNGLYGNSLEGIYKYNLENGQVISLSDNNGSNFNMHKDTLYYIDKYNDICSVNFANNDKKNRIAFINRSEYEASYLLTCGSNIFYTDSNGSNIYKTDFSGNEKKLMAEYTTGAFQIVNEYLYYRENQSCKLYRINTNGNSSKECIIDEAIYDFYVTDEKIYYKSGDTLKEYNIASKDSKTLIENITSNFVIDKESIYYYSSNVKAIKQYNIESTEEKVLVNNITKDIFRIQGYDNILFYKVDTNSSRATIDYYNIEEGKANTISLKAK